MTALPPPQLIPCPSQPPPTCPAVALSLYQCLETEKHVLTGCLKEALSKDTISVACPTLQNRASHLVQLPEALGQRAGMPPPVHPPEERRELQVRRSWCHTSH